MHLFTYGSLMFDEIWSKLVSRAYRHTPATLSGYVRKKIRGDTYPVVFKSDIESAVDGLLYLNISPDELTMLDAFEGDYYVRINESVQLPDGSSLTAAVYVLRDEFRHLASRHDWNAQHFSDTDIEAFLAAYCAT